MKTTPLIGLALLLLSTLWVATSCGSATTTGKLSSGDGADLETSDLAARPRVIRGALTTAVDERRYKPAAPEQYKFDEREDMIYLVGKLKNVPAQAVIEVSWKREGDLYPLLVSTITGSDKLEFIASLSPDQATFHPGKYFARVHVDDSEVGAFPFEITGKERKPSKIAVKRLKISKHVDKQYRPKKPKNKFKKGTSQLYASFQVNHAPQGTQANVLWKRNDNELHTEMLAASGNHRKASMIKSDQGLPPGRWEVIINIDGVNQAATKFTIGEPVSGPHIDELILGTELGSNNLPAEAKQSFKPDVEALYCGLSLVDIQAGSTIQILWIQVEEAGETVKYTYKLTMPNSGSGNLGASWRPHVALKEGDYKAKVLLNGEIAVETPFVVEQKAD